MSLISLYTDVREEIDREHERTAPNESGKNFAPGEREEMIVETIDWVCSAEVNGWSVGIDDQRVEQVEETA